MKKDKQGISTLSDKFAPTTGMVPPMQPVPKKEDEIRANTAKNIGSTKDSDPTM